MEKNGTKPTLAGLLGTKNRDEQAQRVKQIIGLAQIPAAAMTILFDPSRKQPVSVSVVGAPIEYDGALWLLDQARNVVIARMTEAKRESDAKPEPTTT